MAAFLTSRRGGYLSAVNLLANRHLLGSLLKEAEDPVEYAPVNRALEDLFKRHQPYIDGWAYACKQGGDIGIHLADIRAMKDAPRGSGSKAVEDLCSLADRLKMIVTLTVNCKERSDRASKWKSTSSEKRLQSFYRSFGFVPNRVRGRYDLKGTWHRLPS